MKIYPGEYYRRRGKEYPCYVLVKEDGWNDYWSFKTLFRLTYYNEQESATYIGEVKILDKTQGDTKLPNEIDELEDHFCSLGCDIEYYQKLKLHCKGYRKFLKFINDLAFNPGIAEDFEGESGIKTSLLRYSEAEKAFKQAKKIITGKSYKEVFQFTYTCLIDNADSEHSVKFNFHSTDNMPNRIIGIVGKNGTGKTQYLSKLALDLSGQKKSIENIGEFEPSRPLFNKVIAISYSVFDSFLRPSKSKSFSYKYCGLRDNNGFITTNKLIDIYKESVTQIKNKSREKTWISVLESIIQSDILDTLYSDLFENENFEKVVKESKRTLSSGQSVLVYVITEVIANIKEESLILFDEPEMHLHPNAIANLVRMLHKLLEKFDSYAILATHSPIILQEIPSEYVYVFTRDVNTPFIKKLGMESFGENLTTLTEEVFDTVEIKGTYKEWLEKISKEMDYEKALNVFSNRLSLNARIFLKSQYEES